MMIKKSDLRQCFENSIARNKRFWCGCSWHRISDFRIDIMRAGSSWCVVLVAFDYSMSVFACIARSYPMSLRSAYRLVCSL